MSDEKVPGFYDGNEWLRDWMKATHPAKTRRLDAVRALQLQGEGDHSYRPPDDFYETPTVATRRLLDAEMFADWVWEPACGRGAITKVLEADGHRVLASNLNNYGVGYTPVDFFSDKALSTLPLPSPTAKNGPDIITNPPYTYAEEFIRRALALTKPWRGKVAMLLRLNYIASKNRKDLFTVFPFSRLHIFQGRLPRMHAEGYTGKKAQSAVDFAWFIWDWKYTAPAPTINFLAVKDNLTK